MTSAESSGAKPATQFGYPHGVLAPLILWSMAVKNGAYNRAACDALSLQHDEHVLEIGCGPGVSLAKGARLVGRGGFAAGIDHSQAAVHTAQKRNRKRIEKGLVAVHEACVTAIPFDDMAFDKAYAVNSFQFWPEPETALAEVLRVLKPGGLFVIVQRSAGPDTTSDFAGAQAGWARIERAEKAAQEAGFEVVDVTQTPVGKLVAAALIMRRPD